MLRASRAASVVKNERPRRAVNSAVSLMTSLSTVYQLLSTG